ncbi:hypothetical protein ACH6EH_07220 [Paenibacillus sp. JSM ZJ436]
MSDRVIEAESLQVTTDKDEARFLRVDKVRFQGCNLTEGRLYEINRYYGNELVFADNGEMFVVDDLGKENYTALMVCKTTLYK